MVPVPSFGCVFWRSYYVENCVSLCCHVYLCDANTSHSCQKKNGVGGRISNKQHVSFDRNCYRFWAAESISRLVCVVLELLTDPAEGRYKRDSGKDGETKPFGANGHPPQTTGRGRKAFCGSCRPLADAVQRVDVCDPILDCVRCLCALGYRLRGVTCDVGSQPHHVGLFCVVNVSPRSRSISSFCRGLCVPLCSLVVVSFFDSGSLWGLLSPP